MKRALIICALALASTPALAADDTQSPWAVSHAQQSTPVASHGPRKVRANIAAPLDIRTAPQLVMTAARYVGSPRFTPYARAWCRDAVNAWLRQNGYWTDGDGRARTVAKLGPHVAPRPGVIAYRAHHTGVVAAVDGNRVLLIHGNSHRRVRETWFSASSFRYVQPVRG